MNKIKTIMSNIFIWNSEVAIAAYYTIMLQLWRESNRVSFVAETDID